MMYPTVIVHSTILVSHNKIIPIFVILNDTLLLCSSIFFDARRIKGIFIVIIGRLGIADGFLFGLGKL